MDLGKCTETLFLTEYNHFLESREKIVFLDLKNICLGSRFQISLNDFLHFSRESFEFLILFFFMIRKDFKISRGVADRIQRKILVHVYSRHILNRMSVPINLSLLLVKKWD